MSEVKLISEMFVRPEIEVDESKRVHRLNPFDLRLLLADYFQFGFLFSKSSSFSAFSYLEKLTFSLSQALVHFYPLAGQLVTVPNHVDHQSCCIHIDCSKGPGARVIHASAQHLSMLQFSRPNSDVPELLRSFFDLGEMKTNHDGHIMPLLSVQLTELLDGVFLGVCLNHSVADGTSAFHFQRVWSHIFMGTFSSSIPLPIVERPDFLDGRIFKLPYIIDSHTKPRPPPQGELLSKRFFKFSAESLKDLKIMANSEAKEAYKMISTFEALMAFVWKCITQARKLPSDEVTTIALAINFRPRMRPPLTENYFGNYYLKASKCVTVGDLLDNSVGWAATLLQQTVASQDDAAVRAVVEQALDKGPDLVSTTHRIRTSNVNVGGSTRFDVNESQFGLGKLAAFREGYGNKTDGKVNAFRGYEADDSVDLDICLKPQTMSALVSDQQFMSFISPHKSHFNLI